MDNDDAKARIKIFLQYYIKSLGRWEVCLGLEEYLWQREITSAISVIEAWKCLVCKAHAMVLYEKRRAHLLQCTLWSLAFKERDKTGPVAEIFRVYALAPFPGLPPSPSPGGPCVSGLIDANGHIVDCWTSVDAS